MCYFCRLPAISRYNRNDHHKRVEFRNANYEDVGKESDEIKEASKISVRGNKDGFTSLPLVDHTVSSTAANYGARADNFSERALSSVNAEAAAVARGWLLDRLRKYTNLQSFIIVEAGCGSGRDLAEFLRLDDGRHQVIGFDPTAEFIDIARQFVGGRAELYQTDLVELALPVSYFGKVNAVYIMASIAHVPRFLLPASLSKLYRLLAPNGVLLTTFPNGESEEDPEKYRDYDGMLLDGERWGNYLPVEKHKKFLENAGFKCLLIVPDFLIYASLRSLIVSIKPSKDLSGVESKRTFFKDTKRQPRC